jgi:hypothetical protein
MPGMLAYQDRVQPPGICLMIACTTPGDDGSPIRNRQPENKSQKPVVRFTTQKRTANPPHPPG